MANFTWESTTDDVLSGVDLKGKRALVTGVSAGLGIETSRALLARGAEVVGAARDLAKARKVTQQLTDQYGDRFSLVEVDLASLASVRKGADAVRAAGKPLDIIIANAGIFLPPDWRTEDGFETQMAANFIGHFLLVNRLADLMPQGGRLVTLTSGGHQYSDVHLDDINYERRPYESMEAYGAAKTATALFAVEFDRRHKARGVRAATVSPGAILTEAQRYVPPEMIQQMLDMAKASADASNDDDVMRMKTIPQGAATSLWAAVTAPAELIGGRYCEDCAVAPVTEKGLMGVRPHATDPERARRLWAKSEELVGERFPA